LWLLSVNIWITLSRIPVAVLTATKSGMVLSELTAILRCTMPSLALGNSITANAAVGKDHLAILTHQVDAQIQGDVRVDIGESHLQ
jgi:hypothetical protein